MGFLSRQEIEDMGFGRVGRDAKLSAKASYYNCGNIVLGENVRVDDFCILSAGEGGIELGDHVHIAAYSSLIGAGKIVFGQYSGVSSRVSVYSSSDDYSGSFMVGPQIPKEFTNIHHADVVIGRHVIVGAGTVILPGVVIEDGVAVGALSMVSKNLQAFSVYSGVPARKLKNRKRQLLAIEEQFLASRGE